MVWYGMVWSGMVWDGQIIAMGLQGALALALEFYGKVRGPGP
jgi:hypothetical protein